MVESTNSNTSPARDTGAYRSPQQFGEERSPAISPARGTDQFGQERHDRDRSAAPAQTDGEGVLNKVKNKAAEWSGAVADKAKDLVEEGKTFAQKSKENVKEWAHTAGEKVDGARTSVGEGMERFGGGIREKGASAAAVVGGRLEAAGAYLREHDFAGMNEGVKDVVRRHPVQSVLVGVGLGFILARAMRRG